MAEGIVQLPTDGSGKKLRTQELTVGGQTVEQEVVTLGNSDGTIVDLPRVTGTWGYDAGTSGTATIGAGKRVLSVVAHCTTAGSLTINGGASITVPANTQFSLDLNAQLTNPTIVFTGTDSYFVSFVS